MAHSKRINLICGIALLLLVAACSGPELSPGNALALVPSDASQVACVDLRRGLIEAGCDSRHGKITLSEDVAFAAKRFGFGEALQVLCANGGACLLEKTVIFRDSLTGMPFGVIPRVTDVEMLPLKGSTELESDIMGDVRMSRHGNVSIAVSDSYIWLVHSDMPTFNPSRDLASIDNVIARARLSSIDQISPVADFLADSIYIARGYASVPYNQNDFGAPFRTVLAKVQQNERIISLDARFYNSEWQQVNPLSTLSAVDPMAFAPYIPANTAFVAALSTDSIGYQRVTSKILQLVPSLTERLVAKTLVSSLGTLSGTAAIAIAPGGNRETISDFSPNTWQYCVTLPIAASGRDKITSKIASMCSSMASTLPQARASRTASGWKIEHPALDSKFFISCRDSVLTISNYQLPRNLNSYSEVPIGCEYYDISAAGTCAFIGARVPFNSELMHALKLPAGTDATCSVAPDGKLHASVAVKGGNLNIIQFVINCLIK